MPLAALRYLASLLAATAEAEAGDVREALLPLCADTSPRVRRVAIQHLGRLPDPAYANALVALSADPASPLAERLLSLAALRGRRPEEPLVLARRLLPLVQDEAAAVRTQASAALGTLTGRAVAPDLEPRARHDAWAALLLAEEQS